MATILRTTVIAAFLSMTLVACVVFPTPTPTLVPIPEELVGIWELVRVVAYGVEKPPFGTIDQDREDNRVLWHTPSACVQGLELNIDFGVWTVSG